MPLSDFDAEKSTIYDMIRRRAEAQPDATALFLKGRPPVTYAALVARLDQVKRSLNDCGFGRGDRIGILHSGGPDMLFLLFGITGGATPVPLNPKVTEQELTVDFRQRAVQALVVEAGFETPARSVAQQLGIPIIEATPAPAGGEHGMDLSGGAPDRDHDPAPSTAEDYFVVLLTSGTTEESKVVPIRHRQRTIAPDYLEPSDCGLIIGALHHSGRIMTLAKNLMSGSSSILAQSFDIGDFWEYLSGQGLTQFTTNQAVLKNILEHADAHEADIERSRLRVIFAAGGKVDPEIADKVEALMGAPVIERYNSTETNRIADHPPFGPHKRGSVGFPTGCEVCIRSLDGVYLPNGERGEVVVRGPMVFDGYENNPEANAAAFVDGWFRTGDEGYFDEDGCLTLTGRIKEMINRGGEKVSPAEVDAAITSHPQVREAATFPIKHPSLGEEVAAAVVRERGSAVTERELTRVLLTALAGFKVPRHFVFVDEIPKGATGKVQRYKLAEVLGLASDSGPIRGEALPRSATPLEARLQALWARVLKIDRVGLTDNFFLLGGDSLLAVELVQLVGRRLRCWLPVASLFEAGTVTEMAALIEEGEPQGCIVPIQTLGGRPPFFCIHGARGQVIGFQDLARHLRRDQPFYGIQAVGWDGIIAPFTKKADMAAYYVAEVRKIQPHGPYYLCGYSFGGEIAMHMANILENAGEEVRFLALFDTVFSIGQRYLSLRQWLEHIGASSRRNKASLVRRYALTRLKSGWGRIYDHTRYLVVFPFWNHYRATQKQVPFWLRRPDRINRLMRQADEPAPTYKGDAIYFKAEKNPRSMSHPDRFDAWKALFRGRLEVIEISGGHDRFMHEPHVGSLAEELNRLLERQQPKRDPQAVTPPPSKT
jgi:acyl-CoA synthetase (AMP-forming)/AMP-acid ligase II/thioesterase domain-containing protein/acyl carrier protein